MYEVKISFNVNGVKITQTIATFEPKPESDAPWWKPRADAIRFAKSIDEGYEVLVTNVAEENNAPLFGLVYGHVPGEPATYGM